MFSIVDHLIQEAAFVLRIFSANNPESSLPTIIHRELTATNLGQDAAE